MKLPEWRLPPGVSRALWEYAHQPHIALEYDGSLRDSGLAQLDNKLLLESFLAPGRLVDLGCGTGRLAIPFAHRGFDVVGVDLSRDMLQVMNQKARNDGIQIASIQGNLCELDFLPDTFFDYAIFMFSTLGMLSGAENRRHALEHVRRILKPGGRFAVHVHNLWFNLFNPHGRRWLLWDRVHVLLKRHPGGDKTLSDRGIPHMYMHVFSRSEILALIRSAGFSVDQVIPLSDTGGAPLAFPGFFGSFRANGWIILAHR